MPSWRSITAGHPIKKKKKKQEQQAKIRMLPAGITASHLESSSIVNDVMSYRVIDELM